MALEDVKNASADFHTAMKKLEAVKSKINERVQKIVDDYEEPLETASNEAAAAQLKLAGIIDSNRAEFVKPKTQQFHGIKVGLNKGKDTYSIADQEKTVKAIRDNYTESEADIMIKTEETVIVDSLKNLDNGELKNIGVTKITGLDEVYIKVEDSDVSKVVKGLLKDSPLKSAA